VAGRIVLFGATGYTGRLTAAALVARGARPVLAGRSAAKLAALASELGGELETVTADVERPATVAALVERDDVLVATVGPFARWGDAAADAAVRRHAHYLDSTGEPAFIRRVFERHGPRAARAGIGMVTAFGYDWVPGNLAGALALREAGPEAVRVDTGYFAFGGGGGPEAFSGGTKASLAGAVAEPSFAFRAGAVRTVRAADRYRTFAIRGRERPAVSVGSSEHFALPRTQAGLHEVNAYLGWFGPLSRPLQAVSLAGSVAFRLPGARRAFGALTGRFAQGSTGGPDADARARASSLIRGEAYDPGGELLASVELAGVDAYGFTAGVLAWGAERAAARGLQGAGALGPVDAFGLDELEDGCAQAGIARV
jgi:short subunit dehydrogenase-like uncharacterized protein